MKLPATLLMVLAGLHLALTRSMDASAESTEVVVRVPDGFTIEKVAAPPLVERPIVAAFDEEGRLYVAESSGSNDPVEQQLEERPHRIVRLEDSDGDGKFDRRTVYADHMMFPAGTMFLDGSLYVSAPPSIWKLTDRDGDGVAEFREEWFQGKTLTGCANDLHGPYLGPDGWIYWCKGAFAEQTHLVHGNEWKSRAAHIFRSRPNGSGLEPVMTGGMDNPVDVVFTEDGERIFSATFLEGEGRRDGLVHAIFGGVYGKRHGVLDGHPRTGDLMPALVFLGSAAPSGLERYDSGAFGADFRDNLFACQFNLRKVSRHVLSPAGSSYVTADSDFVTSEHVDFHPTDVLADADGSLLVIDTGGWYKLCCPTSQLWKPDVLGAIYRVRRTGQKRTEDPLGLRLDWPKLSPTQLWTLLADDRPAVRERAKRRFVAIKRGEASPRFVAGLAEADLATEISALPAVEELQSLTHAASGTADPESAALARLWALSQLETPQSRALIHALMGHPEESVRHAAMVVASLYRDSAMAPRLIATLDEDSPPNRRIAAEALGRIGDASAVPHLLRAAAEANDRILQHSITFALIQIADPEATRLGLASNSPGTAAAALLALDQMADGGLQPGDVVPLLGAPDQELRATARWIAARHHEWGPDLASWFRTRVEALAAGGTDDDRRDFEAILSGFVVDESVQNLLGELAEPNQPRSTRSMALRVMASAAPGAAPASWLDSIRANLSDPEMELLPLAIDVAAVLPVETREDRRLSGALGAVVDSTTLPLDLRIGALHVLAAESREFRDEEFAMLVAALADEQPRSLRGLAASTLGRGRLSSSQREELCGSIAQAGPLEINPLVACFGGGIEDKAALELVAALERASALASLRVDLLRSTLAGCGPEVQRRIDKLESSVNLDAAAQRAHIESLLPKMAEGDARRGHVVFHSDKAACTTCHRLAYAGGTIGPELTRIGEIRTERDLLEAILYPSLSFVRSYEPVTFLLDDGRVISGTIRDESSDAYVLAIDSDTEVRVPRDEIDVMQPGKVSIMPAGLDRQLTTQELADLIAFLKNPRNE